MRVMITGHRPPALGGFFENNPLRTRIKHHIKNLLLDLKPSLGISGVALGADSDFIQVCIEIGLPYLCAIPFKGQEAIWPKESQERYQHFLSKAKEVIYVSPPPYHPSKLLKRNIWMLEAIGDDGLVIAIYNGDKTGGTAHTVTAAKERGRNIIIIDPNKVREELSSK